MKEKILILCTLFFLICLFLALPTSAVTFTEYPIPTGNSVPGGIARGAEWWTNESRRVFFLGIDVKEGFQALAKFFFNSAEYGRKVRMTSNL